MVFSLSIWRTHGPLRRTRSGPHGGIQCLRADLRKDGGDCGREPHRFFCGETKTRWSSGFILATLALTATAHNGPHHCAQTARKRGQYRGPSKLLSRRNLRARQILFRTWEAYRLWVELIVRRAMQRVERQGHAPASRSTTGDASDARILPTRERVARVLPEAAATLRPVHPDGARSRSERTGGSGKTGG
jgi:hypothetical protein